MSKPSNKKWEPPVLRPSGSCRCYYPEVTRLGDDHRGNRLLYCVNHGFALFKIPKSWGIPKRKRAILRRLPTAAQIRAEKVATLKRIMKNHPEVKIK